MKIKKYHNIRTVFPKESKSITLAHIHDLVLSWLDTCTLIKSGRVEIVFPPDLD